MKFTTIAVIYNPNSTGPSKKLAESFKADLLSKLPTQKIELIATEHAGHAEELAYTIAKQTTSPLIVSSSGDGGYHEVINGALRAQAEGATPTTGLLPAGNANDHYNDLHTGDIIDLIVNQEPTEIDVLTLTGVSKGKNVQKWSHSYIGFGLTPKVGRELNKTKLNALNEAWIVIKTLATLKSVSLKIDANTRSYDSIIFSNVDRMSKYFTVSRPAHVGDGKFEVTLFRKRNKLKLLLMLLKSSLVGLKENTRTNKFLLETTDEQTLVQLDGEIMTLDARSKVLIAIDTQALRCIV